MSDKCSSRITEEKLTDYRKSLMDKERQISQLVEDNKHLEKQIEFLKAMSSDRRSNHQKYPENMKDVERGQLEDMRS